MALPQLNSCSVLMSRAHRSGKLAGARRMIEGGMIEGRIIADITIGARGVGIISREAAVRVSRR